MKNAPICAYCGADRTHSTSLDLCQDCDDSKPGEPAPVGSPKRAVEDANSKAGG